MNTSRIRLQFSLRIILVAVLITSIGVWKFTPQIRAAIIRMTARVPDAPFDSRPTLRVSRIWPSFQAMHEWYERSFIESRNGFGFSRMIDFDDPSLRQIEVNGELYRVARAELVSSDSAAKPVAYINPVGNPVKDSYKQAQTRSLSEFEQAALKKIRKGRQFVYNGDAIQPQFMGAIRAQASCLACHNAKVGDLLGSFAYSLEPTGDAADLPVNVIQLESLIQDKDIQDTFAMCRAEFMIPV
jgi:hypothetical protein